MFLRTYPEDVPGFLILQAVREHWTNSVDLGAVPCLSVFRVKWEGNETFGDVMNQVQQEELFVKNLDIVDGERIKVRQLVGKGQDGVSEVKEDSLRIPTTIM